MWNLQEAIQLIRYIQPLVYKTGYHCCLGGGILNKGLSDNDLDLYFLPLESGTNEPEPDRLRLIQELDRLGDCIKNDDYSDAESFYAVKSIYTYGPNAKRIDAFIG